MITDELWGGTLTSTGLDLTLQTLSLIIEVLDSGQTRSFSVELLGLRDFRFFSETPAPWTYAEVTEFYLTRSQTAAQWSFDIMLWSEDAGMNGRCTDIIVNGHSLSTAE